MKLGTKIFFCVTIFFSVIFLLGGYLLISYYNETAWEREMENALEQYQYNKFVMQSVLVTQGEDWTRDVSSMVSDMNHTVAIYEEDGSPVYNGFPETVDVLDLTAGAGEGEILCRFRDVGGRKHILVASRVVQDLTLYLVTGIDVEKVLDQQEQMIHKFGIVYALSIGAGMVLILGLSALLTRRIKGLTAVTQKIAEGNYGERVHVAGGDEVGLLAENFNRMAGAVEEKVWELSENARQKEDFVRNFAHELKTPLTSVIGYADRIYQRELSREEQREAALTIWNEGMRLEALSHKLMELAVLDQKNHPVLEAVDAKGMLEDLCHAMRYLTEEKGVTLDCRADRGEVRVDYDLFQSLFTNLVDNAIKAGADSIRVRGFWRTEGEKTGYEMQMLDNGSGIPVTEIQRITEAFYMVDKSRSRRQHGAGLGLSLAERIARIHGGSLQFESDGKRGTKVSLVLPGKEGENA